jgi:ketosteroid isomerase-like protein
MASAHVEFVRSVWAEWERGDFGSLAWAHPDIEYVVADGPAPGGWTGRAGMLEGWRDFVAAWAHYRSEAEELLELEDERVLVLGTHIGRGRSSGIAAEQLRAKGAALFEVRDGMVTKLVLYVDRLNAFADLELEP